MTQYAHAPDGCRLAWTREGKQNAPGLLLCNSIGTDADLWASQLPEFSRHYDVVRFDMRGHGRSDAPEGGYTLETLRSDALAILDAAGIERTHVCGLSLGGAVALRIAIDFPERVDRLVVANSAARIGSAEAWQARIDTVQSQGLAAIADMAMARFFGEEFRACEPATVERFRAGLLRNSAHGYAGCCAALRDADLTAGLHAIQARSLMIAGRQDLSTPPSQLQALAHAISGSHLVELDASHLSNVELPQEFAQTVMAFLSEA